MHVIVKRKLLIRFLREQFSPKPGQGTVSSLLGIGTLRKDVQIGDCLLPGLIIKAVAAFDQAFCSSKACPVKFRSRQNEGVF